MTKYEVAAILAINGLDNGEYCKIPAKIQREMFGFAVVGRKSVSFDSTDQGTVRVSWWTDPTNTVSRSMSYEQFADRINTRNANYE